MHVLSLTLFTTLLLTPELIGQAAPKKQRPNIVLVMTDDQGFGDFSAAGNPVLETPRLDDFASQCPKVHRFYVSPVCSPTRACLLTGRYNYRTRVVDTWGGRSMMETEETTIAEVMRDAGYRTGIFGKWHLGDCYPMRPNDQGFDESLVHRGGGIAQPSEPIANARRYTDAILVHNGELEETKGYCTDVYFSHAQGFIDQCIDADQPFFAYIATNAPHVPLHDVPTNLYEKYKARDMTKVQRGSGDKPDAIARTFAMIENIDQNFGRLMDHLDHREIADNTIVVFLTDNGPLRGRYVAGLRGNKTSVYEGGIRSPLWIRWPNHLSTTTQVKHIAAHIDLFPTLCDAANITLPKELKVDGRSLLPLLAGRTKEWPTRQLFIQTHRGDTPQPEHHFAVISDRYKLLRHSGFGNMRAPENVPFELYDLIADRGEQRNVAKSHPDIVTKMRTDYRTWFDDVSATRPDNYAPPRIHVGSDAEVVTTLTRQDWRPADGVGWGHKGAWLLRLAKARGLGVTLLFRKATQVDNVLVETGATQEVIATKTTGPRIELGTIRFPQGQVDLRITCTGGGKPFAPHQILLTKLR